MAPPAEYISGAMSYRSRLSFAAASFLASSTLAAVVACTANGGGDTLGTDDAALPEPSSTSQLPPGNPPDAAADDAAKDASHDAAKESGPDASKPAHNPGDACKTIDEVFERTCGICGTQQSLCLAKPDGTPGVVSDYSSCINELAEGCIPGTTDTEACGNCGTRKRTCTTYCAWSIGPCVGEPVSSCTPTTEDYTIAGCPSPGTVRRRSCGAACSWTTPFSPACGDLNFQLVVAGAAGDLVSGIYPLRADHVASRMLGACPNAYFSTGNYPQVYVELINPTANTVTLSAWNTAPTSSSPIIQTTMAAYDGNTKPTTDAERKLCSKGVNSYCPNALTVQCGSYKWAGLTGTQSITIPPMSSSLLQFASYYPAGGAQLAEGLAKLVVRTDTSVP